jgi:phage/plasmid-associated DNA primase
MMAYVISPVMAQQKLVWLYGATRSGKSTIKNLMSTLLGDNAFEMGIEQVSDPYVWSALTKNTRMFAINECNRGIVSDGVFGAMVNRVKQLSGRDRIEVRAPYKGFRELRCTALPVLVANELPVISDAAFHSRLIPIHFKHSFHGTDDNVFQEGLKGSLPTIFEWFRSDLKEGESITFTELEQLDIVIETKKSLLIDLNPFRYFIERYVEKGDSKDRISRKEMRDYIWKMYDKYDIDTEPLLKSSFPTIKQMTNSVPRAEVKKGMTLGKGLKEAAYMGLKWKNFELMQSELEEHGSSIDEFMIEENQ